MSNKKIWKGVCIYSDNLTAHFVATFVHKISLTRTNCKLKNLRTRPLVQTTYFQSKIQKIWVDALELIRLTPSGPPLQKLFIFRISCNRRERHRDYAGKPQHKAKRRNQGNNQCQLFRKIRQHSAKHANSKLE